MNNENLIPFNKRPVEEQREIQKKGFIKSAKVRKRRKEVKEIIECIFSAKAPKPYIEKLQKVFPDVEVKNIEELVTLVMASLVLKGNVQAYNALYDRKDGKPKQFIDHTTKDEKINTNKEIDDDTIKRIQQAAIASISSSQS